MIIENSTVIEKINQAEKEVAGLYDLFEKNVSDQIISKMKDNGPEILKRLVSLKEEPSVYFTKEYNSSDQEPDWAIFFVLDLIPSYPLFFYTDDLCCGYENDGYIDGSVISSGSDLLEFLEDYDVLDDMNISIEDAEVVFDYISDLSDDIRISNPLTYYKYVVRDSGSSY